MVREDSIIRLVSWFNYLWQNESYLVESQLVEYASLLEIMSTSDEKRGRFLEKEKFTSISKELKNSLPQDLDSEVLSIFKSYLERISTKSQRLSIDSLISLVWEQFLNKTDFSCQDFARAISVNRNNISHGNFALQDKCSAKNTQAIFYLKEFAKYIVFALLCKSIGIGDDDINNTVIYKFNSKGLILKHSDFFWYISPRPFPGGGHFLLA